MNDILLNTPFRILIIGLPMFLYLFKKNKIALDKSIFAFILNVIISELYVLSFPRTYNLVAFSVLLMVESIIMGWLVFKEIHKKWVLLIAIFPTVLAFIIVYYTELSSASILNITDKFQYVKPINANQFFDLCAIHNLSFIVVLFIWLYATINDKVPNQWLNKKRLVYIFIFLAFFAGSFFSIAFGRYLTTDLNAWYAMWGMVFIPLYMLFYTSLNIMLFWNPAR